MEKPIYARLYEVTIDTYKKTKSALKLNFKVLFK
jgi:hypothetical protein